jgi:hypothetical protein
VILPPLVFPAFTIFQNQLEMKTRQLELAAAKLKKAEKDLDELENQNPNSFAAPSTPARCPSYKTFYGRNLQFSH